MSASQNPHPEKDDELFEEPDYDKFSDEELDALYRGESIESVNAHQKLNSPTSSHVNVQPPTADEDIEVEEIDPALERELQAELGDESFDSDDDWDAMDEDFDDL